ncbi:thioesterase family protein [Rubrivivax albus]|uniref:Thioesterase family protein n=2 Tax=Rubrivivax albus TaxID=2499835 RepID=A0A3S2X158_9BURK|nr:thioesterase family protein [Rubrivivax albus]
MDHPLDQATRITPMADHRWQGTTQAAYANMVGPFGGITCAVLLHAALQHPQRAGDPIALTVNFAGPVADGAFEVEARPLRTNRSTQHWSLMLTQDGVPCASASAVFAQRRPTWGAPESRPPAGMPAPDALPMAPSEGRPAWVRCYDMRFAPGEEAFGLDGHEQAHSESRLWVRDAPPRPLDFVALAALADSFFPRVFVRRRRVAPIGTITLSTYFHADAAMLAAQGDRHLLGTARAQVFRDGYHDQSATLWSHDGHLLASAHQMVYYRD